MRILRTATLPSLLLLSACSMHSTATHWNQRVGTDGVTVFIANTTNVGLNLAVAIPFLGSSTMDTLVDTTTEEIALKEGDRVRVIETSSESYWYGFPPFTWLLTPVVSTVSIEYRPSPKELAALAEERRKSDEKWKARREENHDHVIPDGKR